MLLGSVPNCMDCQSCFVAIKKNRTDMVERDRNPKVLLNDARVDWDERQGAVNLRNWDNLWGIKVVGICRVDTKG
jgi:hypothetical protein